jgi:hypothetical protein
MATVARCPGCPDDEPLAPVAVDTDTTATATLVRMAKRLFTRLPSEMFPKETVAQRYVCLETGLNLGWLVDP